VNRVFLTDAQAADHANRLNQCDQHSLAAEWEVMLLNVFSRVGRVLHEPGSKDDKKADLVYSNLDDPSQGFMAEIITASDAGTEDDNPYDQFQAELLRIAKKHGLNPGGLHIKVKGEAQGKHYHNRKMELRLPHRGKITQFINQHLTGFIKEVRDNQDQPHKIRIQEASPNPGKEPDIDLTILFNPKDRRGISGSRLSYTTPYSATRNPLYRSLEKKAAQLRKIQYDGLKGIICCDGNCDILSSKMNGASDYSKRQIVQKFVDNDAKYTNGVSQIGFILLLWVGSGYSQQIEGGHKLYRFGEHGYNMSDCLVNDMYGAIKLLPTPVKTALNASINVSREKKHGGNSFHGGCTVQPYGTEITISSRSLAKLLAGKVTQEELYPDDGRNISAHAFFNRQLKEGRMIVDIAVATNADEDDDWVKVKFGDPDAAISPFKVNNE
jgi:hypothetical protein